MKAEKKSGIGLLIGVPKPKDEAYVDGDDEGVDDSIKAAACKAILSAIKANDHEALADALGAYMG